jgi:hypothetical protein
MPSVPTGAGWFLRGNLSDGYNDMCSGAGSCSNLDSSYMMDGLCFLAVVPQSWKKAIAITLWELCILTRTFGKLSVSSVAA